MKNILNIIRNFIWKIVARIKNNSPYPELVALLCAAGAIFCSYVLVLWNTIPVYDYYIDAEYICPDSVYKDLKTEVTLRVEPNALLNSYSTDQLESEALLITVTDTLKSRYKDVKLRTYKDYDIEKKVNKELKSYTAGLFNDTIKALLAKAHANNQNPDRLFFSHSYMCAEQKNLFIRADSSARYYIKDNILERDYISSNSIKEYIIAISDHTIDSLYHRNEKDSSFLSPKHTYSHNCMLQISKNMDSGVSITTERLTYKKIKWFALFMPKDISRAYYRLSFVSKTLRSYTLSVEFSQGVVLENMPRDYSFGVNSVEFPNVSTNYFSHGYNDVQLYAAFPDGENVQTVRTFFIAIIITWLLKEFIKALYKAFVKYANIIHNKFSK